MKHTINIRGSWWYIEILWSETIGLCMKLNIIYNIIICNPEPEANEDQFIHFRHTKYLFHIIIRCFNNIIA